MTITSVCLLPRRRALRSGVLAALIGVGISIAHAQTAPYSLFNDSTITSSGNTILASRVPVVLSGSTLYWDVTLMFNVDSSGNLTLAPNYPVITKAPTLIISTFQAGTYVGPSSIYSGDMYLAVSGPAAGPGGSTQWSFAATTGAASQTYPSSGTFYVGPIADNPYAARIKAAGLNPQTQGGWGLGEGDNGTTDNGAWFCSSLLLSFSQTGNMLSITSYTDETCVDHNQAQGQVTYTLQN